MRFFNSSQLNILHYNVGAKEDVKQMDGYQFQR